MCNRYTFSGDERLMAERFGFSGPFPQQRNVPVAEVFPKKPAWVVRNIDGIRTPDTMIWGFPHSVAGKRVDKISGRAIMVNRDVTNVRNYASPFWQSAIVNPARRCLVPFTAFSEYGSVRGEDGKLPLQWFDVTSQEITSFAGIWRPHEVGAVFAFLTTDPNPLVAPIHPKAMPVLLHEEDEDRWLTADYADAITLAVPFPSQLMRIVS